jgi:hypothetical protein
VIFVVISVLVAAFIYSPSITFAVPNVVIQQLTPIPSLPLPPLFGQVAPQVQAPLTTTPSPTRSPIPPPESGQIAPETQTLLPPDEQPPLEDEGPVTPFKKWYDEQRFYEEPPDKGDTNGSSDEENGDTDESEGDGGESGDGENGDEQSGE